MNHQEFLDSKNKTHTAKEIYELGFQAGIECTIEELCNTLDLEKAKFDALRIIKEKYKKGEIV